MTVIPNFILKRMYRDGSLRRVDGGIGFDIINTLGPGQISKLNSVSANGRVYTAEQLVLLINEEVVRGDTITEENPATFFLNQVITCVVEDTTLPAGKYELVLDLVSREAGKVALTVKDMLAD
jgi:hypothetical protein